MIGLPSITSVSPAVNATLNRPGLWYYLILHTGRVAWTPEYQLDKWAFLKVDDATSAGLLRKVSRKNLCRLSIVTSMMFGRPDKGDGAVIASPAFTVIGR